MTYTTVHNAYAAPGAEQLAAELRRRGHQATLTTRAEEPAPHVRRLYGQHARMVALHTSAPEALVLEVAGFFALPLGAPIA